MALANEEYLMRVMSFNLRFENDRDGDNAWVYRRDLVVRVIRRHCPSILGTQEGTARQLEFLAGALPEYHMHAPDRYLDETCQYPTLFYRGDQFRVLRGGEFWLSETPSVHRSKSWDSAFPRMISYGRFETVGTTRDLWVMVTHLDHVGVVARKEQALKIRRWMTTETGPFILMGDFNDAPGSEVHRVLTEGESGLRDTWQALNRPEDAWSMTHHGFSGVPCKSRIDWILVDRAFRVERVEVIRDHFDGRYPSDHFPYQVDVEWS
jgi:endonuclease/exonuclease/phosphatase family metal-dependent hydrolase